MRCEVGFDPVRLAFQKVAQLVNRRAVFVLAHRADARGRAQLDVVIQAGALVVAGDLAVAREIRENLAEHVERLIHRARIGERAKVARAVLLHLARRQHLGEGVLPVDLDVGIALVVLEPDVELGLVLLDEVTFQQQRFQFRVRRPDFQIGDLGNEPLRLGRQIRAGVKVRPDAVAQVDGLADVDDRPARVTVDIDAGASRQEVEFLADFRPGFHSARIVTQSAMRGKEKKSPFAVKGLFKSVMLSKHCGSALHGMYEEVRRVDFA